MKTAKLINTEKIAPALRDRAIRVDERKLLISTLKGSDQEADLSEPPNCGGFGRIRHFKYKTEKGWPRNPLPIAPAAKALGVVSNPDAMTAQVFQNAACPWRCWYCFVPYNLLSADTSRAEWLSAEDLVSLYQKEPDPPLIIDLSGGSPDLVPEWSVWMMKALREAKLDRKTYLWSDDNLSTTYLFDKLSADEKALLQSYRNYGRVCCFKGYDANSFSFNTQSNSNGFDRQFEIMSRLLELDIDVYGYLTLTAESDQNISALMSAFVDRLQALHSNLPLRITPLRIGMYGPVAARMSGARQKSLEVQEAAIVCWNSELEKRYSQVDRSKPVCDIDILREA